MTTYSMEFVNNSDCWWHFGVYKEFPEASDLDAVVWQEQGVPNGGARARIDWKINYGVAMTEFIKQRNVEALQMVRAQLGNTYEMVTREGITGINSTPIATDGPPNVVSLKNNAEDSVNIGFALDNSVIAALKDMNGLQLCNYQVNSKYWVALFREVRVGDLVGSSIFVSPIVVQYLEGNVHAKITAFVKSGETLTKVEYS